MADEMQKEERIYLNLNVSHFSCGADDWPADQRRENVFWEVGASIAALDKLGRDKDGNRFRISIDSTN